MPVLKNTRHERFAQEISKGKTLDEAYTLAGFKPNKGNPSTLSKRPEIAQRLKELKERAAEKAEITVARVLTELGKLGFSNISDYVTIGADGLPFVDMSKATLDQMAAVQEIHCEQSSRTETGPNGETEAVPVRKVRFKLADKRQALETIGRHFGMFKDTVDLNVHGEIKFVLEGAPPVKTIDHVP